MAIEWATRVEAPATFADICREGRIALNGLLSGYAPLALQPQEHSDGRAEQVASASALGYVIRPDGYDGEKHSLRVASSALGSVVTVSALGIGDRRESPEYGNFVYVMPERTRASIVLGIALVVGAANACGGEVWDDEGSLLDGRLINPDEIIARLTASRPATGLQNSIDEVLSKTSFANFAVE